MRMPKGIDQIKVWSNTIAQLSLFFSEVSLFSALVAKTVYANPSFHKCHWTVEEIDTLLDLIEVHVKVASAICNRCDKVLTLIGRKWGIDAEEYICYQSMVKQLLKLIAGVAN